MFDHRLCVLTTHKNEPSPALVVALLLCLLAIWPSCLSSLHQPHCVLAISRIAFSPSAALPSAAISRPAYQPPSAALLSGRPAYQALAIRPAIRPVTARWHALLPSPCPAAALPSSATTALHISHSFWFIFLALLSTWPSLPPGRHPLRSFRPLSRQGCPGNPESTLS